MKIQKIIQTWRKGDDTVKVEGLVRKSHDRKMSDMMDLLDNNFLMQKNGWTLEKEVKE